MALNDQYTVYHIHSHLSNGITNIDSVTRYDEYIAKAKEFGMKAMASQSMDLYLSGGTRNKPSKRLE